MTILVTGARGKVGRHVVRELESGGHTVRAASRRSPTPFDWGTPDTWEPALSAVTSLFLVLPGGDDGHRSVQGIGDHVQAFLDVARGSDLDHVVLMTALGMQYAPAEVEQRAVEIAVQAGHWRSSILRPNWFYQNITEGVLRDLAEAGEGVLRLPTADAAVSFIDVRDIAAVGARILVGAARDGEYDLTGPQSLTFAEIARASAASGGLIHAYESVTDSEFRSTVVGLGWDEMYVEVLSGLMATIAAGHASAPTSDVYRVLGRDPLPFADFVADSHGFTR